MNPPRRRTAPALGGGWPLAGHLPAFLADRLGLLEACGQAGDAVSLRLGPWPATVFSHPEAVREVLVERQGAFRKSPALRAARMVLGDGLLTSEGEAHRRHRRLVQPAIGRLPGLGEAVARHLERVTAGWREAPTVDVHTAMREFTLAVAAETLFGADLGRDARDLPGWLDDLLGAYEHPLLAFARFTPWLPLPAFRRWRSARRHLGALVRERVVAGGSPAQRDVLAALLRARDERGTLSAAEVDDEVVTLLLAGHETTASTLTWTVWLLAAHPEVAAEVAAEALSVRREPLESTDDLVWTRAAVAEALRLYPPSWAMGRQALDDVLVAGYLVPRGSLAIVSQWLVHRDPRWWSRPAAFVPSRWVDGPRDGLPARDSVPAFAYFPFGGGRRRCVGESMAWEETVLAVATLLRRWRLETVPGRSPQPRALLTLRPEGPVPLRCTPRPR